MIRLVLTLLFVLLVTDSGWAETARLRPQSWAVPVLSENLKNWYWVDGKVYRSEQPDAEAMAALEQFGIRRVLNLREFHEDRDEAKDTGLELFHLPLNAGNIQTADMVKALKIIRAADTPILIHCWHGSDRTGAVVAMYRIIEQGWSREAALDELVNGGYGYHSIYGNIRDYILAVDVEAVKKQVLAP